MKNIMEYIEDPVMIIAAKDVNQRKPMRSTHSVVVITNTGTTKKPLIVPIELTAGRYVDGEHLDVNVVSSIYEKNTTALAKEAIAQFNTGENSVFYVKKEATNLLGEGVQFPNLLEAAASHGGIVTNFAEKVNRSVENILQTRQFKRWFGDWQNNPEKASKVINEDGTPKIVYHGTNREFNVFDTEAGTYFFSESRDYAESMAEERNGNRIVEAYLNMRNPMRVEMQPGDFSDNVKEAKYIREARRKGKDGVIFTLRTGNELVDDTFYCVFDSKQIKSINNIGTFDRNNPDIRYSMSETWRTRKQNDAIESYLNENPEWAKTLEALRENVKPNEKAVTA